MENNEELKELRDILITVLKGLGETRIRTTLYMAIIRAHGIESEMVNWLAQFYGKSDSLTIEAFVSKLNELTDENAQETD